MKTGTQFVFMAMSLFSANVVCVQATGKTVDESSITQELPGVEVKDTVTVTSVDRNSGVLVRKVSFLRSNNIVLVGNVFLPRDVEADKKYPTILSVHPAGSVKEQSLGLYAHLLAEKGFVTLSFDAAYAGESGGTPHYSEAPYERIEDIRYAIDYLVTLPFVDEQKIGALGLCAGGGYVIGAAPTERRIRAVAGALVPPILVPPTEKAG